MVRKIVILGSTGSIGTQALDVVRQNPERFKIAGLTCGKNVELLKKQIEEFKPEFVCVEKREDAASLMEEYKEMTVYFGANGLNQAASFECDMVLNALMGMRGLEPTVTAIIKGTDIALANKETLVAGGELVTSIALMNGVKILPVDSEHSAIFQCLEGNKGRKIKKILLTCSGGPFRGYTKEELAKVTLADALKHPKWNMGKKITIDSATLMNKGLEIIEAKWLFDCDVEDIQVLIHPQSIVHSGVEFMDNSVITQMGVPDMRIPISLALGYPDRLINPDDELDFFTQGANLTFEKPDYDTFECLNIAIQAIKKGGSFPVVMNAANEELVEAFLNEKISFIDIQNNLKKILDEHKGEFNLDLKGILRIDKETREKVKKLIGA